MNSISSPSEADSTDHSEEDFSQILDALERTGLTHEELDELQDDFAVAIVQTRVLLRQIPPPHRQEVAEAVAVAAFDMSRSETLSTTLGSDDWLPPKLAEAAGAEDPFGGTETPERATFVRLEYGGGVTFYADGRPRRKATFDKELDWWRSVDLPERLNTSGENACSDDDYALEPLDLDDDEVPF